MNSSSANPAPSKNSLIDTVRICLEDAKAEDIYILDMEGKSPMSDHMVVASGRSHRHVGAIADQLTRDLKKFGIKNCRVEGLKNCDWVLVDAGDVIVHVFRPEVREFYHIEKMWEANPSDLEQDPTH